MSKRTDKKRQKRFNEVHPTTTAPAAQPVVETAAPTAEPVPEVSVTETTAPVNVAWHTIFSSSIRTANMTLLYLQRRFLINAKLKVWTAPTLRSM